MSEESAMSFANQGDPRFPAEAARAFRDLCHRYGLVVTRAEPEHVRFQSDRVALDVTLCVGELEASLTPITGGQPNEEDEHLLESLLRSQGLRKADARGVVYVEGGLLGTAVDELARKVAQVDPGLFLGEVAAIERVREFCRLQERSAGARRR